MKETTLDQFLHDPRGYLDAAQREQILVTAHGEPLVVLVGVQNKDLEDTRLEASREFWRMIEDRRRRPTMRLDEVEPELFAEDSTETG